MDSDNTEVPPNELLKLLSDGKNHSGKELALALNVSRTTIWKQLAKLEALGLKLLSKPGKGYCVVGGIELLNTAFIHESLASIAKTALTQLTLLRTINSTNTYLLEQKPCAGISVCLAEHQTAGRGRRGRHWVSPFASNIYLSLRLSRNGGLRSFEAISLAVGVVVAEVLSDFGVEDIKLKWPNDILWLNKKLGGILVELVGDPFGACQLVVGLGLNLKTEASMVSTIDQPWVALDVIAKQPISRNEVVVSLLNRMIPFLDAYDTEGFMAYKERWERLNAHVGKPVDISMGEMRTYGIFQGINNVGAILLKTEQGIEVFHGGEVSLRASL